MISRPWIHSFHITMQILTPKIPPHPGNENISEFYRFAFIQAV